MSMFATLLTFLIYVCVERNEERELREEKEEEKPRGQRVFLSENSTRHFHAGSLLSISY